MRKQNRKLSHSFAIPCGLVARIRRSHRRGRGSIPRTGDCLAKTKETFHFASFLVQRSGQLLCALFVCYFSFADSKQWYFAMFSDFQYRTDKIQDFFLIAMIPCGLVARIRRFHRRGRGSIPRKGVKEIFEHYYRSSISGSPGWCRLRGFAQVRN